MTDLHDRLEGARSSLAFKAPCRVATTANITLSGEQTIDGVAVLESGANDRPDRVLVKDQTTQTENGIYTVSTGVWSRAKDFDGNTDIVTGTRIYVHAGTAGSGEYIVTTADPIVIDTSNITITSAPGNVAGATTDNAVARYNGTSGGLQDSGVTIDDSNNVAGVAGFTLSGSIELGHASDTTLARASAGDVNIEGNIVYRAGGTDVPIADGGTGQSTAAAGFDALAQVSSTSFGRALLALANAAALRTSSELSSSDSPQFTALEIGDASDTTLARASAGNLQVEGNLLYRAGGTDVPVADGGTGRSSHTAYAVLCGGTTTTAAQQSIASVGSSGQVLTSNGVDALPTFQDAAGGSGITRETVQATTSGTEFDFTGLPAELSRITVNLQGVSLSGTDALLIQIGDSGGIETTGYSSSSGAVSDAGFANTGSTSGFVIHVADSDRAASGSFTITRLTGNWWVFAGAARTDTTVTSFSGGDKELSAELDRVRITRTGTNTFDAGQVNILYE